MNLRIDLKSPLRRNVSLASHCTMQVGGEANYFAEPASEEELVELLEFVHQENIPFIILGKGSNVIFPDDGFPGLVITLIHFEQDKIRFDPEALTVTASSGIYLYRLVLACRDQGFAGTEFLANVPGTLGGALIMNAGFSRFPGQTNQIGDLVEEVTILHPDGRKAVLAKKELEFSYRHTNLQGKIVLAGKLKLWRRKPEEIQQEIRANFEDRNRKQDLQYPSSGSIFKNPRPPLPSAGELIERLGWKGAKVGGAMVSVKHGNYIINNGGAKSADVVQLIQKIKKAVLDATGILLESEVRIMENPGGAEERP